MGAWSNTVSVTVTAHGEVSPPGKPTDHKKLAITLGGLLLLGLVLYRLSR